MVILVTGRGFCETGQSGISPLVSSGSDEDPCLHAPRKESEMRKPHSVYALRKGSCSHALELALGVESEM